MQLSVSTASELGSSHRLAISVTLLFWVSQSGLSSGPPPPAPKALDVSLEGSRKLRLHHLSLTRCAVQRPSSWGRKYHENGKCGLAHDSVSLTCLFAVSALHTLLLPPPVWRRLKKLSLQSGGEAKKSFPSPESQAGEERDIGIDLVSALVPPQ